MAARSGGVIDQLASSLALHRHLQLGIGTGEICTFFRYVGEIQWLEEIDVSGPTHRHYSDYRTIQNLFAWFAD